MDHHQEQNRQGQQQSSPSPAPIAPNSNGMVGSNGQVMGAHNQTMLMGLMTNPALAAAAAASPLFPPAAMLTNPGAFFAMPDIFAASGTAGQAAVPTLQGHFQHAAITPQVIQSNPNINGTATMYTDSMGNQVQHVQSGQQHIPQMQMPNPSGSLVFPGSLSQHNSSIHAHMMAAAAAAQAVADNEDYFDGKDKRRRKEMSAAERAKQNRDRNREHARSTRLRKKAYVQKLKELVDGLHAERTEEVRQRRVAIQHLAEMQNVRRAVIRTFLQYHCNNERDKRKWSTILEDDAWLKQPVTPYRCFRRSEIENECRMSRGLDAIIADAASTAVMIEGVGSRSTRWMQIKRENFFLKEEERTGTKTMPRNVGRQTGRFQHAVSSLSSSSANSSNNCSSGEDSKKKQKRDHSHANGGPNPANVSNSGSSNNKDSPDENLHDYHAKPLPDPFLQDSERGSSPSEDSPEESNTSAEETKRVSTDSSSGDDSAAATKNPSRPTKRRKHEEEDSKPSAAPTAGVVAAAANASGSSQYLPHNIAKRGGISHNVRPAASFSSSRNGNARLSAAPAIILPPFAGLGKRTQPQELLSAPANAEVVPPNPQVPRLQDQGEANGRRAAGNTSSGENDGHPAMISGDVETSSSNSSNGRAQMRAYYHVNEDDMILMEDILMCPFVFRTQDAVLCGALAECVMPGMLRVNFSPRNKIKSLEMTYDAMGFMQQLERASGSETTAQIIPGSLEMALSPSAPEARAITMATAPYRIVSINEPWTRLTKYTQVEVEGEELFKILEGEDTEEKSSNAPYDLQEVAEGRCICATRLHYDKDGEQFVDFICSYPLTNTNDEITHLLHISKKLPPLEESVETLDSTMDEAS